MKVYVASRFGAYERTRAIEAGAALIAGKRLWVIDPVVRSIFWRLAQVRVFEDESSCLAAVRAAI
jgi:hypothetical protein